MIQTFKTKLAPERVAAIQDRVAGSIEKFGMFSKDKPIPVGFSGGKDSATLIFVLRGLGYDVRPVIADGGIDPRFNSRRIADVLFDRLGIRADILKLRETELYRTMSQEAVAHLRECLFRIDNLGENETLCTPCYNARTIAMTEYVRSIGASAFAIGQHKTDMITSLTKSYWTEMYWLAFTKPSGIPYDGNRMRAFIGNSEINIRHLEVMVAEGRAATDDPPVEIIGTTKLVRPLEAVNERETKEFAEGYPHESDNCSYREKEPRPFRLLVQFDLKRRVEERPELETILYGLVQKGLNEDGTLRYRPRNARDTLYPGFKPFLRKVGAI